MTNFELKAIGGLANGQQWTSRIYVTGSVAEATAAGAASTGWQALWGDITAYLPVATTLTMTQAVTLNAEWKYTTGTSTDQDLAGTSEEDSLPIGLSAVMTWRTAQRNRSGRGRAFLPASAVNSVASAADTGLLLPAFRTAITTGGAALLSAIADAELTPVIKHRDLTTDPIIDNDTGVLFRRQFRRQDKVANNYA